jgi:hypothetical protein
MIPLVFAQDANIERSPESPFGVLGQQLIVWSEAQKPQPLGATVVASQQAGVNSEQQSKPIPEFAGQQPTESVNPAISSVCAKKSRPEGRPE